MRVGEIQQFCQLQKESQGSMWAATSCLPSQARRETGCTIADFAGSEKIQSVYWAEVLHASRKPKLMDRTM